MIYTTRPILAQNTAIWPKKNPKKPFLSVLNLNKDLYLSLIVDSIGILTTKTCKNYRFLNRLNCRSRAFLNFLLLSISSKRSVAKNTRKRRASVVRSAQRTRLLGPFIDTEDERQIVFTIWRFLFSILEAVHGLAKLIKSLKERLLFWATLAHLFFNEEEL